MDVPPFHSPRHHTKQQQQYWANATISCFTIVKFENTWHQRQFFGLLTDLKFNLLGELGDTVKHLDALLDALVDDGQVIKCLLPDLVGLGGVGVAQMLVVIHSVHAVLLFRLDVVLQCLQDLRRLVGKHDNLLSWRIFDHGALESLWVCKVSPWLRMDHVSLG